MVETTVEARGSLRRRMTLALVIPVNVIEVEVQARSIGGHARSIPFPWRCLTRRKTEFRGGARKAPSRPAHDRKARNSDADKGPHPIPIVRGRIWPRGKHRHHRARHPGNRPGSKQDPAPRRECPRPAACAFAPGEGVRTKKPRCGDYGLNRANDCYDLRTPEVA